jgi:hypothetical protein
MIFSYFFLGFYFDEITTFILVTVSGAVDFWVVKNVTGRLLVGLRWWSDFDQKGKEVWRFESYNREHKFNGVDATFFWTGQIVGTLTWAAFLAIKILSFDFFWVHHCETQALLVFINFSLCSTNLYGYYKCRGGNCGDIENITKNCRTSGIKASLRSLINSL